MQARKQTEFARKWVGVCEVFSKEKKARLTSLDVSKKDGKVKLLPNGSTTMDVVLADLPKAAQRVIKPNMATKKFRIRLNEDGDGIDGVTPVNGMFAGHAVGLGPKKQDGTYSLIHKTYNEGKEDENSHDEFLCIYEITEGVFKGVELPGYYLHYKFEEIPAGEEDEGFTRFNTADTPQAKQLHKLQAWAEVHGNVLDEPIRWPDDGIILDVIEERVLDADRPVNLIFENGYISSVQAIENYDDEDESDDDIDDKFPEVEAKEFSKKYSSVAKDVLNDEVVEVPAKTKNTKALAKKVVAKAATAAKKSSSDDDSDDDL